MCGPKWRNTSNEHILTCLLDHERYGKALNNIVDSEETGQDLLDLIVAAKTIHLPVQSSQNKRKRPSDRQVRCFDLSGTKCQRRNFVKKLNRTYAAHKQRKQQKRRACFAAFSNPHKPKKGTYLIGSWNTRGMGAPFGKDPAGKEKEPESLQKGNGMQPY